MDCIITQRGASGGGGVEAYALTATGTALTIALRTTKTFNITAMSCKANSTASGAYYTLANGTLTLNHYFGDATTGQFAQCSYSGGVLTTPPGSASVPSYITIVEATS